MNEDIKKNGKSKKFKVIIIIIVAIVLLIAVAVGIIFKVYSVSDADREEALNTAGKEYYEKYMAGITGLNQAEISVEMLQIAIDQNGDNYDLTVFEKCESDTKILFTLEDGEITEKIFELNCN